MFKTDYFETWLSPPEQTRISAHVIVGADFDIVSLARRELSFSPTLKAFNHKARGCPVFRATPGQSNVRRTFPEGEQHRNVALQEEFRTLLRKYGIEYDERYVWD